MYVAEFEDGYEELETVLKNLSNFQEGKKDAPWRALYFYYRNL